MLNLRLRLVALSLALTATGCATASQSAPADGPIFLVHPTVGPAEIRMSNGQITLTIVPALGGRIVRFGYCDGPNVLWTASHDSLIHRDWGGWSNIGGDKAWVWPQSDWKHRAGQEWPPPTEFDAAPWAVTKIQDGEVELISPPLPHFGSARLLRRITMPRRGKRVIIQSSLLPSGSPACTGGASVNGWKPAALADSSSPMAPWEITQVPLPAAVIYQQSPTEGRQVINPRVDGKTSVIELNVRAVTAIVGSCTFTQQLLSASSRARCRVYIDPRPDRPVDAYAELEWAGDPVTDASCITVEWGLKSTN